MTSDQLALADEVPMRRVAHPGDVAGGRAESGFTLIEVAAAMVVLTFGILGTITVFMGALKSATASNNRSRASALAIREIEGMQAVRYADLGLDVAAGVPSSFPEGATVDVAGSRVPWKSFETLGGRRFDVERRIVHTDATTAAGVPVTDAYKKTVVIVTWTDNSGAHTIREDSLVYPGNGENLATTTTVASASPPAKPTALGGTAFAAGATCTVDLTWSPPPSTPTAIATWVVEYRSASTTATWSTLTQTQPAGTPSYTVTGLACASSPQFRVFSRASDGTLSTGADGPITVSTPNATTTPPTACAVTNVSITPNAIGRANNGNLRLASDATVTVTTIGSCPTLYATYNRLGAAGAEAIPLSASGSSWSGAIEGTSADWDTGSHPVSIRQDSSTSSPVLSGGSITVCVFNASSCP